MNHSCVSLKEYVDKKNMMYGDAKNSSLKNAFLKIKFSKIEILHLLVATILVTAVGLSLNNYKRIALEFLIIFVSAFLVHEMAHKLLGQYY